MRVVEESWYHVPMQMRHDVTETREIDLFRRKQFAQQSLDRIDDAHQPRALRLGEVRHFLGVGFQNHAAESGVIGIAHEHHAREAVVPEHFSTSLRAQRTVAASVIE